MYTVYDLLVDVKNKIHGSTIPSDMSPYIDEGRRNMIKKIRPPEMAREGYIEEAIYPKVQKYAIPEDLKYEDVINIRLLSAYRNLDTLWQPIAHVYRRELDHKNRSNIFAINWDSGVKTMSVNHFRGIKNCNHLVINDSNSLTDNGTWNVGGNVVNLRLDELNHITRKASLKFDINNSSTSGFLENFTMHPVHLEDYMNTGAVFTWANLPIPQYVTSIKLYLYTNAGDLTTDYFYSTVNQAHDSNTFVNGWNLMKYMLNSINSQGIPDPKNIIGVRVEFTTTGEAIPNCNLDAIQARKGEVYSIAYNSRWCLIDSVSRAWKMRTTSNADMLPFEEDSYQVFMLEVALSLQKYIYSNNSGAKADVTDIQNDLESAYFDYRKNHKGEFIEPEQNTNVMGRQVYGYYQDYDRDHHHRPDNWFEDGNGGNNCNN